MHMGSEPLTSNPVRIEMSFMVMDVGLKGKRNEFKHLNQNLRIVLIKSKARFTLTLVSLRN